MHNYGYDTDQSRVFLWDNLNSHLSHLVTQTVVGRGGQCNFTIVPCPPYQPKDGAIKYVIFNLAGCLTYNAERDWKTNNLEQQIHIKFSTLQGFSNTFDHCGYSEDGTY